MKIKEIFYLVLISFFLSHLAFAHPGRTDFNGGHTCNTNCAQWSLSDGEYHIHSPKNKEIKLESKQTANVTAKMKSKK